jgi:hypothetical protein
MSVAGDVVKTLQARLTEIEEGTPLRPEGVRRLLRTWPPAPTSAATSPA